MSREIKFRVWNNCSKRFENKGFLTSFCNEQSKNYKICGVMEFEQNEDDYNDDGENVVIQQFIGLTDKNGIDIYEGDIVFVDYNYLGRHVVEFKNGSFNTSGYVTDKCVVIGNVYQTPELTVK